MRAKRSIRRNAFQFWNVVVKIAVPTFTSQNVPEVGFYLSKYTNFLADICVKDLNKCGCGKCISQRYRSQFGNTVFDDDY